MKDLKEKYKNTKGLEAFFEAVLMLDDMEECYRFFDDICTVQELKAISQRLEVAKMLTNNCAYNSIVEATGASTATISRVNRSLHYGSDGYKVMFVKMDRKNKNEL